MSYRACEHCSAWERGARTQHGPHCPALISECGYADVRHWDAPARLERGAVIDTPLTVWFRAGERGCAGLKRVGRGYRIKGVFVDPAHRGRGIGTRLAEHLIEKARADGGEFVEAFAHNERFYLERGFIRMGANSFGVPRVRKVFR